MAMANQSIPYEKREASQHIPKLYKRLNTSRDEIRLLEVLREPADDGSVSCRLFTTSHTSELQYSALSYVWGEPTVVKNVTVNGLSVAVTMNLANALANIRSIILPLLEVEGTAPYIWADALCINQTDIIERNEQVTRMGKVYNSASHVLSWLGCGDGEIKLGLQTIREIADKLKGNGIQSMLHGSVETKDASWIEDCLRETPGLCQMDSESPPFSSRRWNAVFSVMNLTYWKRLWILQETVLAKSPESHWLFHDDELVTYSSFDLLITLLRAMGESKGPSTMDPSLWFGITQDFADTDLTLVHDFKQALDEPHLAGVVKVTYILRAALRCACKNPHDVFYALLGVIPIKMEPDYRKSMRQVYLEWAKDLLLESAENGALFLQHSGTSQHQHNEYNLPSWLPDFHHRRTIIWATRLITMLSSTDYLPSWVQPITIQDEDTLCILGTRCDEINQIVRLDENTEERFTRIFLHIFFETKGDLDNTGVSQLQAVFTVLLACWGNMTPDFSAIETQLLAVAFVGRYLSDTEGSDLVQAAMQRLNTKAWATLVNAVLIELFSPNHPAPDFLALHRNPFTTRMGAAMVQIKSIVARIQCIFRLPSGYLGGGPPAMRAGDKVCVLSNCKSPVILRQDGAGWIYVGTCFVLGLSDGEVFEMIDQGRLEVEEFRIH